MNEPVLKSCAALFSTPNQGADVVADSGCKEMVALFKGKNLGKLSLQSDTPLSVKRYVYNDDEDDEDDDHHQSINNVPS